MAEHQKRYMADGTATTRRVDDVVRVKCDNAYHVECFEPLTSWAGDPIPMQNNRWHIHVDRSGKVEVSGDLADRESAQFMEGMRRRVRNKRAEGQDDGT